MPRFGFTPFLEDRRVLRVDRRFRARIREPRERVEEVVPALRARLDFAGFGDVEFVIAVGLLARWDETKRLPPRSRDVGSGSREIRMRRPSIARQLVVELQVTSVRALAPLTLVAAYPVASLTRASVVATRTFPVPSTTAQKEVERQETPFIAPVPIARVVQLIPEGAVE